MPRAGLGNDRCGHARRFLLVFVFKATREKDKELEILVKGRRRDVVDAEQEAGSLKRMLDEARGEAAGA